MKRTTILLFILFLGFTAQSQLNINHYIKVGRTRISIGNYVGAIEYFNIVIKFKPHLPEPYYYRGLAKHQLEDYRGSIKDYNRAIKIKPYYPDAFIHRGMAYHNLKDYDKAIKDYNKALEFNDENEIIYNNRGIAKISLKDVEGAIKDYNKALEISPKSINALMNRSNAKIIKGDVRGAIRDLNQAIVIRPHYAGAYLNRGLARFELNDYASALRDYDQCIKLDPKNALAYNNRGIVKHKLEDYGGAIMDYDMALSLDPQQATAYFNRAMAKEILGRTGYERDYKVAALLNPKYDLSRYKIDSEALAQNQQQRKGNKPSKGAQPNQGQNKQQNTNPNTQQKDNKPGEEKENQTRRRRTNLIIADNRNLPDEEEDVDDGRVQNKNIAIDLQPIFMVSAFEKDDVDYEQLQYYNPEIEALSRDNNYNPTLTVSNKASQEDMPVFSNFVLYFNERITIQETSHNYLNRGIFHCLTGDYSASLKDLDEAIKMEEKNGLAYFSRGNCRLKMIEKIELLPGANETVTVAMGSTQQPVNETTQDITGDYDKILEDYRLSLYINPGFFFGYFNRAYIMLKQEKYYRAMEDLNKAIELEPEFAEAYFNRGLTKIYLDDLEGGAMDLSRAGELGIHGAYNVIKRYCN